MREKFSKKGADGPREWVYHDPSNGERWDILIDKITRNVKQAASAFHQRERKKAACPIYIPRS